MRNVCVTVRELGERAHTERAEPVSEEVREDPLIGAGKLVQDIRGSGV